MANRLDLTLRINGEDRTGPARTGIQTLEQRLTQLRNTASTFLALKVGDIISGQIGNLIKTADAYKTLEGRLKLVSDNTSEYAKAQTELFNIAQRTRGDLAATYNVYGKLETAIKQLGGSQQQALTTTETLNQAIALTSQGAAQDAAAIMQFSQALGSGVLRGDEFNSVMENSPGLADALAYGLGVTTNKLRGMAEAGQLTSDKLINALGKSSDMVAAKFAQIPLTVGGAVTQLNNAFTTFIGQADKSSGASATLATSINTLAKNLNNVADVGLIAAEVYGAKLVLGLSRSTQSLIESAMASRQASAASVLLIQQDIRRAEISVTSSLNLIREAQLQRALAANETQRAAAMRNLDAAYAQHAANVTLLNTQQANLNQANGRSTLSTILFGGAVGGVARAFALLNVATQLAFSAYLGYQIGKWLRQFEPVQYIGANIAEMTAKFVAFGEVMTRPLSVESLRKFSAELDSINSHFDGVRENIGKLPVAIAVSEAETTQALEAAALKQQESFKAVQEATKALTASIDAESKQQTMLIEQGLIDRLAAIDAMDVTETQKDTLRVNAKLASYQQLAQLQQQSGDAKLALIEKEYAAELAQASNNAQRMAEIETQKRQAKLSVYTGLADYYQGEIAKLSTVYAEETAAFAKSREDLQALERTHDQALRAIDQEGKTEHEKISQDQNDFDAKLSAIAAERKKGEKADQQKINELTIDAKNLSADLTKTNVEGGISQYKAKNNLNRLYGVEKEALIENGVEHGKNALAAKSALDRVTSALISLNATIGTMTEALNKDYALKLGVDQASLTTTQSTIAELTKPETKVITIDTQQTQSPEKRIVREGSSFSYSYEAQSKGGPAGRPTNQPWQYASGGYTPRAGKLPGFGGGDKINALLEAGEFIVRKEAVKKYGEPFMQTVNAGQMTVGGVIKRAFGGLVDDELAKKLAQKKTEEDVSVVASLLNNTSLYSYSSAANANDPTRTLRNMLTALHTWGRDDLAGYVAGGMPNDWNKDPKLFNARKELIIEKIKAGATVKNAVLPAQVTVPKITIPKLPEAVTRFNESVASSKLLQAAQPQAGKTVNVQFAMPGGEPVAGQFNESDIDKLFKTLKDAGLRSSGGHF